MNVLRFLMGGLMGRRLPRLDGELRLNGPLDQIIIRRDNWGIPHIDARNDWDALFALGYCQGQDRPGQLEVLWRLARGRLAEWVGPAALRLDRLSRRIGFWQAAQAQLSVQAPWVQQWMAAFVAGVNAAYSTGLPRRPHEFVILGGQPSRWDEVDLLAVLKLQSFLLPSNWDMELLRLRLYIQDGPQAVLELDPLAAVNTQFCPVAVTSLGVDQLSHSTDNNQKIGPPSDTSSSLLNALDYLRADLEALQAFVGVGGGSNNWVIAGQRTATGKPLLANDPHLTPSVPAPWYLAHVRTPEWEVAGAMFAGSLGFAIGHNGFCAWGVTAALSDNTDLFIEKLSPDGSCVQEADGSWQPCQLRQEVISVRGQPDHVEEVRITPRGPIISPALAEVPYPLSLRAVWLDPLPIDGFLSAPRARSFEQFRRAFQHWPLLPLNVVYADRDGTIGYQIVGQIPRRRGGYGLLPRPANCSDSGWQELVPFDQMPYLYNPPCGYLATANQDPRLTIPGMSVYLGADYCDSYRYRAVIEALAARPSGWTVEDCLQLQRNTRSVPWEDIRDVVLGLNVQDPEAQLAVQLLKDWDGQVDTDSPAAAVFEVFLAELLVELSQLKAARTWQSALQTGDSNLFADRRVGHLVYLVRTQPPGWVTSWPGMLEAALSRSVRRLRQHAGPAPPYWAWGHLRRLRLKHLLFGQVRGLATIFNLGPLPCPGDANTISQAAVAPLNPFADTHNMANLRAVFDLNDLENSRFVLCGGQSGNPCSPHYADQLPLWHRGEAITIPWSQAAVMRATRHTLRLLPQTSPRENPSSKTASTTIHTDLTEQV
ncbi:MAG: penicillin acylase family protein [Gemmataceae bacterium]|nr:penicillin acylase family protein [Gemmataceae bacterium]